MGVTFSTVFESEVLPHETLGADHRALVRVREGLDRLAAKAGLTSLLAFESYAPEDTEGLLDEETQAQQPPAEWFPASAGLTAIDALYEYLEAHSGVLAGQAEVWRSCPTWATSWRRHSGPGCGSGLPSSCEAAEAEPGAAPDPAMWSVFHSSLRFW